MTLRDNLSRRSFCVAALAASVPAQSVLAEPAGVRFAMIADVHHNRMPGARQRLEAFLAEAKRHSPDFLIQLGDFCDGYTRSPDAEQKAFLKTWHQFPGAKYNVLGNHEMDRCTKPEAMEFLEMPKRYYSFDQRGIHFIVLDCMNLMEEGKIVSYDNGSYFKHSAGEINLVDPEQLEWLTGDLKKAKGPVVVFTHPCINSFWVAGAEATRANVLDILSDANRQSGWQKVVACFSGHHHVDHHSERDGVNYLLVNSASYYWVGKEYGSLAKYRDPLFAFVSIEPSGSLAIEGKASSFEPPTPADIHFPDAGRLTASIESRTIRFRPRSKA
jgi:3',5'-cyclic AMP phosphodiesterase CpdA